MAELPKIAEEAVKKIDSKLECSICMDKFKEPKLLPCFHIFCKTPCLERLVVRGPEGQTLTCPTCRHLVTLSDKGVVGLQTDFHVEHLYEIRESLDMAKRTNKTDCENCEKAAATTYCQQCGILMCPKCTELHPMWGGFRGHKLLGINEVKVADSSVQVKQLPNCQKHPETEAKVYCKQCSEFICSDCTVCLHRNHDYDLAMDVFAAHKQKLISNLKPLKEKLEQIQWAFEAFDTQAKAIEDQRNTVQGEICTEISKLQQCLDEKCKHLVALLDEHVQQKRKRLVIQLLHVECTREKMSSCLKYAESGLETWRVDDIVKMKGLKEYSAVGDGIKPATIGQKMAVEVIPVSKELQSGSWIDLKTELVHAKSITPIKCHVRQRGGRLLVTYQPTLRGKHSLHIKIGNKHIQGSPYNLVVAPSKVTLGQLKKIMDDLGKRKPYKIACNRKGDLVLFSSLSLMIMYTYLRS